MQELGWAEIEPDDLSISAPSRAFNQLGNYKESLAITMEGVNDITYTQGQQAPGNLIQLQASGQPVLSLEDCRTCTI